MEGCGNPGRSGTRDCGLHDACSFAARARRGAAPSARVGGCVWRAIRTARYASRSFAGRVGDALCFPAGCLSAAFRFVNGRSDCAYRFSAERLRDAAGDLDAAARFHSSLGEASSGFSSSRSRVARRGLA